MDDNIKNAVAQYRQMQTALNGGCHDGYCVIEKTKGMHTNGGCGCMGNLDFISRQRVGHMLRASQILADYVETLIAQETDT